MSTTESFGVAATMVDDITGTSRKIRREVGLLYSQLESLTRLGDPLERVSMGLPIFSERASQAAAAGAELKGFLIGARDALNDTAGAAGKAGTALGGLGKAAGAARTPVAELRASVSGFISSAQGIASHLGGGVIDAFKGAIHVAAEYDQKMTFAAAVTHATAAEADAMRAAALKLVAVTTLTAKEAAEGFVILGNSGLSAAESIAAIRPVANLSMAGMVNMKTAAQITTDAMRNFNLSAEESTRITDVMMRAHVKGGTSIEKLGYALSYSQNMFGKTLGKSIEETAGALAFFSSMGIRGSRAGTSMTQIATKLIKPSKELDEALKFLGKSMADVDFKTHTVAEVFQTLEPLAQNTGLSMKLFGLRAGPAFLAALSQGAGGMKQMIAAMNSGVTAGGAAENMMNTVGGALKYFTGSADTLKIALVDTIKVPMIQFIKDTGDRLSELAPVAAKLTPVMSAAFSGMTEIVTTFGGAVMSALGMTGVGQVFNLLKDNSEEAKGKINELVQGMIAKVEEYTAKGKVFVVDLVEGVTKAWETFKTATAPIRIFFGMMVDSYLPKTIGGVNDVERAGQRLGVALELVAGAIGVAFTVMFAKLVFAAGVAGLEMMLALGPVGIALGAIVGIGVAVVKNWDWIKKTASDAADWISEKWSALGDLFKGIGLGLVESWNGFTNGLKLSWLKFMSWWKNSDSDYAKVKAGLATAEGITKAGEEGAAAGKLVGRSQEGLKRSGEMTAGIKAVQGGRIEVLGAKYLAGEQMKAVTDKLLIDAMPDPTKTPEAWAGKTYYGGGKKGHGGGGGRSRREPLFGPGSGRSGTGARDYQGEIRDLMNQAATTQAWGGDPKGLYNQIQQIQVDRQLAEGKRRTKLGNAWGVDPSLIGGPGGGAGTAAAGPSGSALGRGATSLDALGTGSAMAAGDRAIERAGGSTVKQITISVGQIQIVNTEKFDEEVFAKRVLPVFQRFIREGLAKEGAG